MFRFATTTEALERNALVISGSRECGVSEGLGETGGLLLGRYLVDMRLVPLCFYIYSIYQSKHSGADQEMNEIDFVIAVVAVVYLNLDTPPPPRRQCQKPRMLIQASESSVVIRERL